MLSPAMRTLLSLSLVYFFKESINNQKMSPIKDKRFLIKLWLIRRLRKRTKRQPRSYSIRPLFFNRMDQGDSILVRELREDPQYHHRYFRMNKENFDTILSLVAPEITGCNTHSRPITAIEKVAIALRYLASGNSQISLSMSYRISPSSISKIVREVLSAVKDQMGQKYLPIPTESIWVESEKGFNLTWNFPNCIGAMDGKHFRIKAPPLSGSINYNYKGYFSVVLLAVVDPNYKFIVADIGSSGSQSDGGIFARSTFGKMLEAGKMSIPKEKPVGGQMLPHIINGDDAFPLKSYIMKPYPGKALTVPQRIYNYRQSRARMVVENTFGILAARWRIFHSPIQADNDLVLLIIESAIILHNYLIDQKDFNNIVPDRMVHGEMQRGNWRETINGDTGLERLGQQGSNNYTSVAADVRNKFKDYFSSGTGAVSWQNEKI